MTAKLQQPTLRSWFAPESEPDRLTRPHDPDDRTKDTQQP